MFVWLLQSSGHSLCLSKLLILLVIVSGNVNYRYPSLVELEMETHGGDDVMVFARGPWAHLFTGNFEQNQIPLAMALAAGISTDPPASTPFKSSATVRFSFTRQTTIMLIMLISIMRIFRFTF